MDNTVDVTRQNLPTRQFQVEVEGDHLESLAKCSPTKALAELIWNAFDAGKRSRTT